MRPLDGVPFPDVLVPIAGVLDYLRTVHEGEREQLAGVRVS